MKSGTWYVIAGSSDSNPAGARILEVGAGAKGTDGLVAVFEMQDQAEAVARAHNAHNFTGSAKSETCCSVCSVAITNTWYPMCEPCFRKAECAPRQNATNKGEA